MSDPRSPPDDDPLGRAEAIPLSDERLRVDKRTVERTVATVRLRTKVKEVPVCETLRRERVEIERRPVDRIVDEPPATREEGGITIIPVVEEVLVRRFRVVEELHVRRQVEVVEIDETVTLRRQEADVDETDPSGEAMGTEASGTGDS